MKKQILILTLILGLSGLAAAQAVQLDDANEFPEDLTGGESFELGLNYSVDAGGNDVPLHLELDVSSSEYEVPEEAFSVNVGEESHEFTDDSVYRVNLEDTSEDGSVTVDVESDVRLKSGNYDFSLDLLSQVGLGEEVEEVKVSEDESAEVEGESSSVSIESETDANASVAELDFVGAEPPSEDSEFLGGVEVDVQDEEGNDVGDQASGTVRVEFDEDDVEGLDQDSLAVYFYNDSSSEWEALDSEVGDGFVEADVDHFSVYSVYGEEESSSTTIITSTGDEDEVEEEEEEETEDETEEAEEDDADETDESDEEDEDTQEDDDTVDPETPETEVESFTGQAFATASSYWYVFLLALVGVLVYWKREEIRESVEELR